MRCCVGMLFTSRSFPGCFVDTVSTHASSVLCLTAAGDTGPRNMAVVDIVRDRERGMVRYNQARRQYGLRPLAEFEDINGRDNSPEAKKARCH